MEKITLADESELFATTEGTLCLTWWQGEEELDKDISKEEATNLLKESGIDPSVLEELEGFNEQEQEFLDLIGRPSIEIEEYCSVSYRLGFNPLPNIRKLLQGKIPVYYFCSSDCQLMSKDKSLEGQPYLAVIHDIYSHDVTATIMRFWFDDRPAVDLSDANEQEDCLGIAFIGNDNRELIVPELEDK